MKMINGLKIGSWMSAIILMLSACSDSDTIQVQGTIDNPGNVKVVSFYEGERKLDSTFIGDGNRFKFERPATQERLLTLEVGNNRYPLILEPGQPASFNVNLHEPTDYQVGGSELSTQLKEFAAYKERIDFVRDSLQLEFSKATTDLDANGIQNLRAEMLQEFRPFFKSYIDQAVEFARKNDNLAGFYVMSTLDPEMAEAELIAICDVQNPLCGPTGAAAIFAPQKGATPEQVKILDENAAHLAKVVTEQLQKDYANLPGAGAAGGLGFGLMAFANAKLQKGIDLSGQLYR